MNVAEEFIDKETTVIIRESELKYLKDFKWSQYPDFWVNLSIMLMYVGQQEDELNSRGGGRGPRVRGQVWLVILGAEWDYFLPMLRKI